jgi:hypothetical protein
MLLLSIWMLYGFRVFFLFRGFDGSKGMLCGRGDELRVDDDRLSDDLYSQEENLDLLAAFNDFLLLIVCDGRLMLLVSYVADWFVSEGHS